MKISKNLRKGIFCLEGYWEKDLRVNKSIEPTLEYLNRCFEIRYIYNKCAVQQQFTALLKRYNLKTYDQFSILYLAFHGHPNSIMFGKNSFELNEIAEICENKLTNKIVHFGSCSTLKLDKRILKNFIRKTNALCISGYKTDVDFNKSTVLDMLYFEMWQTCKDVRKVERNMFKEFRGLSNYLEFRMVYI